MNLSWIVNVYKYTRSFELYTYGARQCLGIIPERLGGSRCAVSFAKMGMDQFDQIPSKLVVTFWG
jgi:hypothetical protein